MTKYITIESSCPYMFLSPGCFIQTQVNMAKEAQGKSPSLPPPSKTFLQKAMLFCGSINLPTTILLFVLGSGVVSSILTGGILTAVLGIVVIASFVYAMLLEYKSLVEDLTLSPDEIAAALESQKSGVQTDAAPKPASVVQTDAPPDLAPVIQTDVASESAPIIQMDVASESAPVIQIDVVPGQASGIQMDATLNPSV